MIPQSQGGAMALSSYFFGTDTKLRWGFINMKNQNAQV